MKVLITGGCGFLGSNLAAHYLDQGAEVIIIDALFRKGADLNRNWLMQRAKPRQLSFFQFDLAARVGVEAVFQAYAPFDYVCHFGGQVAMTTSLSDPERDMMTNVVGTFNVLEAVRKYSPDTLVAYSSTNKVYGDLGHLQTEETSTRYVLRDFPNGLDEKTPLDFASPYGCSKGAADQYVRDWHRNYGLRTVVFRHSSIYGGRQFASYDQGWVGWFCKKAIEQRDAWEKGNEPNTFTISGSGKQVRDVLHADDLIRLYHRAWENADTVSGEIFNIGGGAHNSLSLLELFSMFEGFFASCKNNGLRFVRQPRRKSDQDVFIADIRKVERALQWSPKVTSEEGVHRMLDWVSTEAEK